MAVLRRLNILLTGSLRNKNAANWSKATRFRDDAWNAQASRIWIATVGAQPTNGDGSSLRIHQCGAPVEDAIRTEPQHQYLRLRRNESGSRFESSRPKLAENMLRTRDLTFIRPSATHFSRTNQSYGLCRFGGQYLLQDNKVGQVSRGLRNLVSVTILEQPGGMNIQYFASLDQLFSAGAKIF